MYYVVFKHIIIENPFAPGRGEITMAESHIIYGFHAVISRLRQDAAGVTEIYLDNSRHDRRAQDLVKLAESAWRARHAGRRQAPRRPDRQRAPSGRGGARRAGAAADAYR